MQLSNETKQKTTEFQESEITEHLIYKKGLGRCVKLLGAMSDVRTALSAMDFFVLPSVETFSNAALEAMSMGLPVVLNNKGGAKEMAQDGVNGYLFSDGDANSLVAALNHLIEDKASIMVLGSKAQDLVAEKFTFNRMVTEYETLLPTF